MTVGSSERLTQRTERLSPARRALLELRVGERLEAPGPAPTAGLGAAERPRTVPLDPAGRRVWMLEQIQPGTTAHVVHRAVRIRGALDRRAIEDRLSDLLARHEELRSTVALVDGTPCRVVAGPASRIAVKRLPVGRDELPPITTTLAEEARRPFDLAEEPPLRVALLEISGDDHVLFVALHRIAAASVSGDDLVALLLGRDPGPERAAAALPAAEARRWWRSRLAGAPAECSLPGDRRRPGVQSYRGAAVSRRIPGELLDDDPGVVLLAGVAALVHRYTQSEDVVVGFRAADREELPVRLRVAAGATFSDLRAQAAAELQGLDEARLPLDQVLEEASVERDLSRPPLFQVLVEQPGCLHLGAPGDGEARLEALPVPAASTSYDVAFTSSFDSRGAVVTAAFASDLYESTTAERFLGHLEALLSAGAREPARAVAALQMLSPTERRMLVDEWNRTAAPFPSSSTVHQLFERRARETPDAPAASFEAETLTYAELDRRANRLAHRLVELGVGPDVVVGICMTRSLELVVAVLAALKAGGAYVPLDPAYPPARLAFMLEDCAAPVLLANGPALPGLPDHAAEVQVVEADGFHDYPATPPRTAAGPRHLAYVIYTSGSTGVPKGVAVEHRGACNLAAAHVEEFRLGPGSRVLQFSSLSFDAFVWELLMALTTGGELCLAPADRLLPGRDLVDLLRQRRITTVLLPPSTLALVPEAELPDLRTLLVGGEACTPELVRRWAPGRTLVNCYGPTETTVLATTHVCLADGRTPPIGRPIRNVRTYVLDRNGEPVPVGIPGELWIGGAGVARGYVDRAPLTDERFLPDPFSAEEGARIYGTGDLVRFAADGELQYLGRLDDQVKIRGFRIEVGEIEAVLERHPAVTDCAVTARDLGLPVGKRLVAYVVFGGAERPGTAELRRFLRQSLPAHFVPSVFVELERLPLTPAKKVDRPALPDPDGRRPDVAVPFVAPRTPFEDVLAQLFAETIGVDRVGIDDGFFDLGGDSLRATQTIARVPAATGVVVPLRTIFEHPTVRGLAAETLAHGISGGGKGGSPAADRVAALTVQRRILLERKLLGDSVSPESLEIRRRSPDEPLVLSFPQQRLWFLDQWAPESALYNAAVAARLTGEVDRQALATSLRRVVERHEALRTVFPAEGGIPVQSVLEAGEVELVEVDLGAHAASEREPLLGDVLREHARRPFDLARDLLVRTVLVRLADREHVLMLVVHHIAADGWSKGILFRELGHHYRDAVRGEPCGLPPLPIQYADFALWQRRRFAGEELEREAEYWRARLAGAPPFIDLPTDRPRPVEQGVDGVHQYLNLPFEQAEAIKRAAAAAGVTPYMFLLAVFATFLGAYAGQDDILVGSPIANRHRPETEGLIGFFVNTLVLRVDLSGDPTFRELLAEVREVALGAYGHQDLPFEKVVEVLRPRRHPGRNPLFQVNFRVQTDDGPRLALEGLDVSPLEVDVGTSRFDLALELQLGAGGITGYFEYRLDLFEATTVKRMAGNFVRVLNEAIAEPERRLSELGGIAEIAAHRAALLAGLPGSARATSTGGRDA